MIHDDLTCAGARERLSARLDGELRDEGALGAHLASCGDCRLHERALAGLSRGFRALREDAALPDLWPRIERRAGLRPAPLLARVAAALVGFAGLGGAALLVERERPGAAAEWHMLERLALVPEPDALFASLPEYRILRAFPRVEEHR